MPPRESTFAATCPLSEGRCRKIGQFRPRGMEQAATVYELLLPAEEDPTISDQHLADFEGAVELISQGQWDQAKNLLAFPPGGRSLQTISDLDDCPARLRPASAVGRDFLVAQQIAFRYIQEEGIEHIRLET